MPVAIGEKLRRAGLTQAALLAWAGTHRLSALRRIRTQLATRPQTPGALALALFVAGVDLPLARLRALPLDELLALGLVEIGGIERPAVHAASSEVRPLAIDGTSSNEARPLAIDGTSSNEARPLAIDGTSSNDVRPLAIDGTSSNEARPLAIDHVRATVSVLPLEHTLVVCDRFDAPSSRERVLWPDDSSYHLASAISPGRRDRWIDLATGSAFAPLMRPALAARIIGVDLNPRAVELARLGAALSGCTHFDARCADIGDLDVGGEERATTELRASLVTCNAPILDDPDPSMWRSTDRAFFDRMWSAARACVDAGGEIIVHCVLDAVPTTTGETRSLSELDVALEGDVAIVVYTPPGERAYAVTWWSPDAPDRRALGYRELTPARPHLEPRDRDDLRAGMLRAIGR